jgi:methylmalonyl-CoA mutase cobalamin-binding subunit
MPPEKKPDDDGKPTDDKKPDLSVAIGLLAQSNKVNAEAIAKISETQGATLQALQTLRDKMDAGMQAAPTAGPPPMPPQDISDVELEGLSRRQFADYQLDKVKDVIEGALKPIHDGTKETQEQVAKAAIQQSLREAQASHLDFAEWKNPIMAIAKAVPGITPEDAYQLARAKDPERAIEMDAKYGEVEGNDDTPGSGDDKGANDKPAPYGGTPPSGGTTEFATNMSQDDAATKAWDETMSHLPKELYSADG